MKFQKGFVHLWVIVVLVITAGIFTFINTRPVNTNTNNAPVSEPKNFSNQELQFETISKRAFSGHRERSNYVIKDNTEWNNLWNTVHSTTSSVPNLPDINFNNEMIIAVFQSNRNTGGYDIEIINIVERENSVEVFAQETSPPSGPGSVTTQAFTDPYHIVKTKRVDKEVAFKN